MSGIDDKGTTYSSIDEMWEIQLHNKKTEKNVVGKVGSIEKWYNNANQYWSKTQPTYNGVLGGYGNLSTIDIRFSLAFILSLVKIKADFKRQSVLDCGAGIGRISKELLCQTFKTVDVVDQCQMFIEKSKQILKDKPNVRHYFVKGLQELEFIESYDCIWVQWVFSHLNDEDAINFLCKARKALKEGGLIIMKENHCKYGFVVDKQDYSVTRSTELYKQLFQKAGLTLLKEQTQKDWPEDLFGVRIYALC